MKKPMLIIMAAGMGSRYGGLKQIEPIDENGHLIIDFSLYDAKQAGFDTVVFVITKQIEKDFRQIIGNRIEKHMNVLYAYQNIDSLPSGFSVPDGRKKPWGTAHAVLSAKDIVDQNFAVINADDYYGAEGFKKIFDFLSIDATQTHHAMVGYLLENTITEHGSVARGVCKEDEQNNLIEIIERTQIVSCDGGGKYTEDGENYIFIPGDTTVSMNLWGFHLSMMKEIENRFSDYLKENLPINPLKCEYFLPLVPNILINENKASIKVLSTKDKWYGITYKEDMPIVKSSIAHLKSIGKYPNHLWEGSY